MGKFTILKIVGSLTVTLEGIENSEEAMKILGGMESVLKFEAHKELQVFKVLPEFIKEITVESTKESTLNTNGGIPVSTTTNGMGSADTGKA